MPHAYCDAAYQCPSGNFAAVAVDGQGVDGPLVWSARCPPGGNADPEISSESQLRAVGGRSGPCQAARAGTMNLW